MTDSSMTAADDVATATPRPFHRRSERALDAATFCLADVADGLGPFLVIDLTSRRGWSAADAGAAMSMLLIGTVVSQSFTGSWIDGTRHKRTAIAVGALLVAFATLGLYYATAREAIFTLQAITGVVATIFPPAIAAISLGLVGRLRFPARVGRNEACFHAGNVTAAVIAITLSRALGNVGIFYGVAMMAVFSAIAVLLIRERDIDHVLARGADGEADAGRAVSRWSIVTDRRILLFAAAVVLFHFANAAMLPLVGQKVGHTTPDIASTLMAVCIIVAQVTMIPVAILASKFAVMRRKPVLLVGFCVLPLRGLLYTLTDSPVLLIGNQILDGIGAGIFGVVAVLMIADLTRGTGRFNFAQGVVATSIGLGAALSNYVTGLIVDARGFDAGFLFLSTVAVGAALLLALGVGETAPHVTGFQAKHS